MTSSTPQDALLDTIFALAMEIAQHCPDAAERATRIAELVGEIRANPPLDRGTIQDILETELDTSDVSDLHVRTTTEAVVKAVRQDR